MKALVKPDNKIGLELRNVPKPKIKPHDVLIEVKASSICGSDIPIFYWDDPWVRKTVKPGQIIGHEFCGIVTKKGRAVEGISVGDFVTAEAHINCGGCFHCKTGNAHICPNQKLMGFDFPGVFAEFVSVPANNVIRLGKQPLPIATIQDPLGNAVNAAMKTCLTNASVLITGSGPIGLMSVILARVSGSSWICATDIVKYRRDLAIRVGADLVLDPFNQDVVNEVLKEQTVTSGVDVFFEMSGSTEAMQQGFKALRPGGQAVLLGLPKTLVTVDFSNDIIAKGITVHGVVGRKMFETWFYIKRYSDLVHDNKDLSLRAIITHFFLLDDFEEGFELMRSGECGKVILYPDIEDLRLDPYRTLNN